MASAVTDLFRKSKSLFSTTTTGSINDSVQTIALNSVSGLPTDTGITVTIDRVDSDGVATGRLERAICTISGSNLVNCTRGNDSTTAQTHPSGAIVECVFDPRIKPKEMKFREWIEKSAEAYCNEYPDEGYKSIWDEVLS